MRTMISTTPMAEYIDMMYTRLALEMPRHTDVVDKWWVELHPPLGREDGVGSVLLLADLKNGPVVEYAANMHAVQRGANVPVSTLTQVADIHIGEFVRIVRNG